MLKLVISVTGARVLASGLQALTLLALTQTLGPSHFGQFATVSAVCGVAVVVLGLGLSSVALRVSALEDARNVATTVALLRVPVTVAGAGVAFAGAALFFDSAPVAVLLVAALYAAVEAMGMGVESVLYGLSAAKRAQLTLLARRTVQLGGIALGLLLGDGLLWFAGSVVLVALLLGTPLLGLLSTPAPLRRVLPIAFPLWPPTVLAKVQLLDVLVASITLSSSDAGIYAAATRLTSPLNTFAVATLSVLTPRLASRGAASTRERLFMRSRRAMFVVVGALAVLSPVVGWLTDLVLGEAYQGIFWTATVLTCMTAVAAMTQIYVSWFYAKGDGSTVAKARVVVVPASLVLGGVLASFWGPIGLGVAMLLSQLCLCVSLAAVSRRSLA